MSALLDVLLGTVLPRVLVITALIAAGVGLANLLVEYGVVQAIARGARYLTGPANLPDEVGAAVLTNTVSVTAGYGMLAEFRDRGVLDDRATLVAVVMNTFFGFVQHLLTYYLPVLLPILGLRVGLLYVGTRALIALCITLTGVLAGALVLTDRNVDPGAIEAEVPDRDRTTGDRFRRAGERTLKKVREIVPRLVVIYTAVVLALEFTDLEGTTAAAEPLTSLFGLPGAAVPVILVFVADTTSGAIVLAPLVGESFTARQAVIAMLLGGILSFSVSTLKRSIPFQYGIWGAEFGTKVILVNTALQVVFLSLALAVFLQLP